jgi:acyl-CoA dehydrogenase
MSTSSSAQFRQLLTKVQHIATEVAAKHAASVDAEGRFPHETLAALREAKALSAPVPQELGGLGCTMRELAALCSTLSQACGSSGMVLAMHYIQVACVARHGMESAALRRYLQELVEHQYLLASMTSEVGTFGETRQSVCAVERNNGRFKLDKDATTGSYCAHADAILVTCRRAADAAPSDQVMVLVLKDDYTLQQTTSWDTLGMRGTCSPGFKLQSTGPEGHIVPGTFAESSAQTMVPYSHILWASLWWGIAAGSVSLAAESVRTSARKNPGTVPANATRLAEVSTTLQAMRHNWFALATEFDEINERPTGRDDLLAVGWALKMNNLKIYASEVAPQIVHQALQIIGILAYKNDSRFSLGRHYRDVLSAALMISNDRIASKSAAMLLVLKEQ